MAPIHIHKIVRYTQLVLSIAILVSAAFLLHYRTNNHSNFTGEPLVSCISGAVAFIYAFWSIINHKKHPDGHNCVWVHWICCLAVSALLLAASILAFKNHNNEFLCTEVQPYEDAQQFFPGEMCTNNYEGIDEACAVLGIIATLVWLIDFCIIVGVLSPVEESSKSTDRSQVGPDDGDGYYNAQENMHWNTRQYSGYSHDNRYIDSERKERSASAGELKYQTQVPIPHSVPELNCSEPESLRYDDNGHVVRGHIIEISMDEPIHTNGTSNGPPIAADYSYLQHKLPDTPPAVSLGLPSHPRTKWEYNPSPVTQCVDRLPRHNSSTYTGDNSSPQTPSDRGITSPSFVGSPMIPSCYAFDPNQQKYLPAFVNVAARAEQGHKATRELVKRCLSQPSQSHSQVVKTRNKSGQSPQLNALSLSPFHFEGPLESEGSESYFPSTKPTKDPLKLHCDINDIVIDTSSNIDNNISVENNLQAISPKSIYRGDF